MSQPPHSSWTSLAHIRLISDPFTSCLTPNLRPCLKVTASHILSSNWFTQCMWSPDAILSASYYVKWVSMVFAFSGLDKCVFWGGSCVSFLCVHWYLCISLCVLAYVCVFTTCVFHPCLYLYVCVWHNGYRLSSVKWVQISSRRRAGCLSYWFGITLCIDICLQKKSQLSHLISLEAHPSQHFLLLNLLFWMKASVTWASVSFERWRSRFVSLVTT